LYEDQLANAIVRVISAAALRAELWRRGLDQVTRFNWMTTAVRLMQALRQYPQRVDS